MPADGRVKIAPSILAADFGRLGEQVAEASEGGADYIHVDVMDGHFVPALTFGPQAIDALRRWTELPLDVHMMVSEPQSYIADLAAAGADMVTIHAEAETHLHRAIYRVKEAGMRAGVALNPSTAVSAVVELLPDLDLVLVMTVNPGLGGQPFIESMLGKIARVRAMLDEAGSSAELEVDGGIGPTTAGMVARAGARVLVAGSAVYGSDTGVAEGIARIRESASEAIAPAS